MTASAAISSMQMIVRQPIHDTISAVPLKSCDVPRTTLNWPQSFPPTEFDVGVDKRKENMGYAMVVALQINVALWVMLGCAAVKAIQFVEYVN
jgi:hypothetical protein